MGRLTLNVLLSFAQFEREVTGERIRDKIAASKKKGMWMGGLPPLGYDEKKKTTKKTKTQTTHHPTHHPRGPPLPPSPTATGTGAKAQPRPQGKERAASLFALRGALYLMLQNRIYRGEIVHKNSSYPGEHAAIIDAQLWETVQPNSPLIERAASAPMPRHRGPLRGLMRDGGRMSPTYTRNTKAAPATAITSRGG